MAFRIFDVGVFGSDLELFDENLGLNGTIPYSPPQLRLCCSLEICRSEVRSGKKNEWRPMSEGMAMGDGGIGPGWVFLDIEMLCNLPVLH